MFEEMKTFISKETEVNFDGWSCLTALVLPNVRSRADLKENVKQFNHKVITSSDNILSVLNIHDKFDVEPSLHNRVPSPNHIVNKTNRNIF